jgi:hypothetical protein
MKRKKMSKKKSARVFKRGRTTHKKNIGLRGSRGGIRL